LNLIDVAAQFCNPYLSIDRQRITMRLPATDTVEAILNSAERRIRKAGYGGFSFRDIAAEVGVTSASVHYHFPTKDALAAAVARRYNDRIASSIDEAADRGADIVQAWREVFRLALAENPRMCLCGSLGVTAGDLPPAVAREVDRFFDLGVASLMAGGLTSEMATQILATLEGAILIASVRGDAAIFDHATAGLNSPSIHSKR
jgi:TetR/AcrR family transcriptional regulator, transcriptional repressor for nem operon